MYVYIFLSSLKDFTWGAFLMKHLFICNVVLKVVEGLFGEKIFGIASYSALVCIILVRHAKQADK